MDVQYLSNNLPMPVSTLHISEKSYLSYEEILKLILNFINKKGRQISVYSECNRLHEVGKAINSVIIDGFVTRKDLFIRLSVKVHTTIIQRRGSFERKVKRALTRLGLKNVDLLIAEKITTLPETYPIGYRRTRRSPFLSVFSIWYPMVELYRTGKTLSIGTSLWTVHNLHQIVSMRTELPHVSVYGQAHRTEIEFCNTIRLTIALEDY